MQPTSTVVEVVRLLPPLGAELAAGGAGARSVAHVRVLADASEIDSTTWSSPIRGCSRAPRERLTASRRPVRQDSPSAATAPIVPAGS